MPMQTIQPRAPQLEITKLMLEACQLRHLLCWYYIFSCCKFNDI